MLLWFAGLSFVLVVAVFRDAALDYRLVMLGAIAPDILDLAPGSPGLAHTLGFSVGLLTAVMLLTRRRRGARRRWLALPIGTFVHLVLDGAWTRTALFWFPFLGSPPSFELPSLGRPLLVVVAQEAIGGAALLWCWRRFRLGDPTNRTLFVGQGRLQRDLVR